MRLASRALARAALAAAATNVGCSAATSPVDMGPPDMAPSNALVRARPFQYDVPQNYSDATAVPLVILLHGYGANGYTQAAYFGINTLVDKYGFLLAYPDGTKDTLQMRFWNATDACCDFGGTGIDDVAYVNAIIDDMSAHYNVDKKRIFVTGHSNGAFMSHRFACDHAERVAAIGALAGDDWADETKCNPSEPVAVLQIHGDADESVPYLGAPKGPGVGNGAQPSARESVAGWAKKNGCAAMPTDTSAPPLDLDAGLAGAETTVEKWTGCKPDGAAELWTIKGGMHLPNFRQPVWPEALWGWLSAHAKK